MIALLALTTLLTLYAIAFSVWVVRWLRRRVDKLIEELV